MSCGVGGTCGSDPSLLWLWHRPAATAPIRPLAWEPPCAAGAALEKKKTKKSQRVTANVATLFLLSATSTAVLYMMVALSA